MTGNSTGNSGMLRVGQEWIAAVLAKDFQALAGLCHPAVRSRLMTPKRIDSLENAEDLARRIASWFQDCSLLQTEQQRVGLVGEMLAISYRLAVVESGQSYVVEQQIYCNVQAEQIDQLSLLCSGFQPAAGPMVAAADQADAFLKVETGQGQESTCAILTPAIKRKLGDILSGQVLEVLVDDPSAKEDIEAWCRLSGNALLKMDPDAGQALRFYLRKK